eukprot:6201603-Pleurochrysis_carterae.AAC.4
MHDDYFSLTLSTDSQSARSASPVWVHSHFRFLEVIKLLNEMFLWTGQDALRQCAKCAYMFGQAQSAFAVLLVVGYVSFLFRRIL